MSARPRGAGGSLPAQEPAAALPDSPPKTRHPVSLAVFFGLVGFVPANWLVRVPDVKAQVGASAGDLGLALLCGSLGSLAALTVAARLCERFGTRRVLVVAGFALCAILVLPGLAGSVRALGAALAVFGVAQSTFNIALNSTAVEVATASGNPLMPTLHGIFSVGGLVGAALGGLLADHLSPVVHLGLTALLGLAVTAVAGPALLRSGRATTAAAAAAAAASGTPDAASDSDRAHAWRRVRWVVLAFGLVAACTAFGEYASNNWAALHLRQDLAATAAVAGYGYATYACAIAGGRFLGSRLIRRLGETAVLSGGFALAAVGVLVASWAGRLPGGGLPVAFAGYVVLGLGLANVYPVCISRAGALGGPRGVSRISMSASVGILSQGPLIGFVADRRGLPLALSTVAVLAVLAAGVAFALRGWTRPRTAAPTTTAAAPPSSATPPTSAPTTSATSTERSKP
ncbi:Fucose permease [Actinopolymorpha cephalotaxi]|uniref:Fucose permease n=1 Tax=Actinopolymorpha cephalotaxi TaxID=504797 RepID=A0A1I2SFX0_9ACTN|nr:MFS transporter [Actinopolymorpha cephalotaxi]NYH83952.1 MFS family permease [Actinopolymorpha cephalotaxi]SFG51580.1 Fucose permease [Actinopolymorpha cephalotaxi]